MKPYRLIINSDRVLRTCYQRHLSGNTNVAHCTVVSEHKCSTFNMTAYTVAALYESNIIYYWALKWELGD